MIVIEQPNSLFKQSLIALCAVAALLSACNPTGREGHRLRGAPPPEAFAACAQGSERMACGFNGPRGRIEGECRIPRDKLVCVPDFALADLDRPREVHYRYHTETKSQRPLALVPATEKTSEPSMVKIEVDDNYRIIKGNALPGHLIGTFPNHRNPHRVQSYEYSYRLPLNPVLAATPVPLDGQAFGIAVNGVPLEPETNEFYLGDPTSGWRYEALSGAVVLGLDENHGHPQPSNTYHYHGLPRGFLSQIGVRSDQHSPITGWAADGFPIYALYGYNDPSDPDSKIVALQSGYRLREGERPIGGSNPGGRYDGAFGADYEYVSTAGTLDQCNGRWTITPDFPAGTYAYFLTSDWPVVPRCFMGTGVEKLFGHRR